MSAGSRPSRLARTSTQAISSFSISATFCWTSTFTACRRRLRRRRAVRSASVKVRGLAAATGMVWGCGSAGTRGGLRRDKGGSFSAEQDIEINTGHAVRFRDGAVARGPVHGFTLDPERVAGPHADEVGRPGRSLANLELDARPV